ncbi:hypothetical protein CW731_13625 [Polaribacter sp. ALD11]|uniref:hypothetical protein n=1 Tax=Polaribacter sp. ALD11 TaxID=2058137 RepID=UPI000C2FF671|nr:hypothetical protein [Polaribacter sp. ALD11]AUC86252.1 hypothetical protein CW731_13625 [Polaribacter sp. ALD11]
MIRKILIVFLLITSTNLLAQRTSSSPYSFFGIGEQYTPRTVENTAMGGIGVAFNHYKYLNFTNPAANAFLRQTTYSLGILNNDLTLKTVDSKESSTSTSLNYIALGFPIGNKAGFSLGLQPLSSVGYSLSNNEFDSNNDLSAITLYSGEGGVNRIYGSFGMKISKQFAVGVEADYSFGSIENSITNQRAEVSLATKYKEKSVIRGGSITFGTQYQKFLKENLYFNAGATLKLGNDLTTTGNEYLYSLTISGAGTDIPRDTIYSSSISGKYKLPLKSILGVGIGKYDKWHVGLEYQNQAALKPEGFINNTSSSYKYENSNRFSLGGFYLPKINSISSYWDRVTYRAGLRYENVGLAIDGSGTGTNFTSINDFGMSFGLGLPLKQLSNVNLGFEYGQRGTTSNNLIQENYFNFRLSLSLTASGAQSWFRQRKID